MTTLNRLTMVSLLALAGLTVTAGCQSSKGTAAVAGDAVMCPKCETTWVRQPQATAGGKATTYVSTKEMKCPECDSAVSTFMKTGKLAHSCKHCGETLAHCEAHTKTYEGAAAVKSDAITCPKCETTWVKQPEQVTAGRSTVTVFRNKGKMTCPDCEKAAATYFKTGQLGHNCPSCGTAMQHCKEH